MPFLWLPFSQIGADALSQANKTISSAIKSQTFSCQRYLIYKVDLFVSFIIFPAYKQNFKFETKAFFELRNKIVMCYLMTLSPLGAMKVK